MRCEHQRSQPLASGPEWAYKKVVSRWSNRVGVMAALVCGYSAAAAPAMAATNAVAGILGTAGATYVTLAPNGRDYIAQTPNGRIYATRTPDGSYKVTGCGVNADIVPTASPRGYVVRTYTGREAKVRRPASEDAIQAVIRRRR